MYTCIYECVCMQVRLATVVLLAASVPQLWLARRRISCFSDKQLYQSMIRVPPFTARESIKQQQLLRSLAPSALLAFLAIKSDDNTADVPPSLATPSAIT